MGAVLFLILSIGVGILLCQLGFSGLLKHLETKGLPAWMIRFPSGFLVGTLCSTWIVYMGSVAFQNTATPLFYGNIVGGILLIALGAGILSYQYRKGLLRPFTIQRSTWSDHHFELCFTGVAILLATLVTTSVLQCHHGQLSIGRGVYSDFGPHLAMIRSFSFGKNFPTQVSPFCRWHCALSFYVSILGRKFRISGPPARLGL